MKSESAISHKIRQVQYRHVKRELRSRFPKGETWDKDEVDQVKAEFREFFAQIDLLAAAQRSATDSQGSPESPSNGSGIPSAAPQTWWQRWFR